MVSMTFGIATAHNPVNYVATDANAENYHLNVIRNANPHMFIQIFLMCDGYFLPPTSLRYLLLWKVPPVI